MTAVAEREFPKLRFRYPVQRVHHLTLGGELPSLEACERIASAGARELVISPQVDLRHPSALDAVRVVRDFVALNVPVTWSVSNGGSVDPRTLTHLWPPEQFPGHDALLDAWREFAFGVLYWRSGPGFVIARDVRPGFEATVYTIDTPAALRYFSAFQVPARVETVVADPDRDEDFRSLVDAGLLMVVGGCALTLPYRIKKWPVPFSSI
jgi:hypothetical protein